VSRSRDKSKLIIDANGDAEVEVLINASVDQISSVTSNKTGYIKLATGSFADRPITAIDGAIRYNTDANNIEYYFNNIWHLFKD
jgi:hypothetical protein